MEYNVLIKKVNPCIDEEVTIEVNEFELICFAPFGIPALEVGKKYKADIGITVLDDLDMKEVKECMNGFNQIDNSFAYYIRGKFDLESRTLDAGILIKFDEDEFDLHDSSYLDGKNVEIRVDRIKIEFID
jgi:hypothetical protein